MSRGFLPTGICAIILSVAVLIRKTSLPSALVTARRLLDEEHRADQEKKREGDLRDNKRTAEASPAATDDGAGLVLESFAHIGTCGLKRGNQAEKDAGSGRQRKREEQNRRADSDRERHASICSSRSAPASVMAGSSPSSIQSLPRSTGGPVGLGGACRVTIRRR